MTPLEFKNLLDKYSRGECTKAEENLVLQWYANIDSGQQQDLTEDERQILQAKLWSRLNPRKKKSRSLDFRVVYKIAAAVTVLALVAASLLFSTDIFEQQPGTMISTWEAFKSSETMKHVKNETNEAYKIELEDGSEVILQPQSEIRYPTLFIQQRREVYLVGEAFFRVKRDTLHPFLVYANEVVTKVLGTSFTVRAYQYDKEVTVAVKSGKVSVSKLQQEGNSNSEIKKEEVILVPNQQAVYHRSNALVTKQLVEIPEIILPKPTLFEMQYDGAPVVKIFRVLEENYGIDIVYDEEALKGCNLTTSMSDEGLYERIKIICEAIGAEYEVQDTRIIIKSSGC